MNMTANRRRALLIGGAFTIVLLLTLLFPGMTPWSPAVANTDPGGNIPGICSTHYYALDAGKESTNAFGPPITARDEATIKAQLNERRLCGSDLTGDPTLTAAHYAAWSVAGLTAQKVDYAGIDAFSAKLVADYPMWVSVVSEMTALESASAFSVKTVPAGSASLYMVPNGAGGVTTHQGVTSKPGTAVVFTHGSTVVELRLDCGFQNIRETFPGVPMVPPGSPETPPPAQCIPGQVKNVNGFCVTPKSSNPKDYRQPGDSGKGADVGTGTKPKVVAAPVAEVAPPVVVTTKTGGAITAPGAAPAPAVPVPPPPNEGGTNNGVTTGFN